MRVASCLLAGVVGITKEARVGLEAQAVTSATARETEVARRPLVAVQSEFAQVEKVIQRSGVTPEVLATVKKLLGMVTDIIEPAIQEAHGSDGLLVLTVFREIIDCDARYSHFLSGNKKTSELGINSLREKWQDTLVKVMQMKEDFTACETSRNLALQRNSTACCAAYSACPASSGDCEVVKLQHGFAGCDYKASSGVECFEQAKAMVSPLLGYFQNQDKRYEEAAAQCTKTSSEAGAKVNECEYLNEAVNAKVSEANDLAQSVNETSVAVVGTCQKMCDDYTQCRSKAEDAYARTVGPCEANEDGVGGECVKNREVDRKNEWDTTQTIKCMLTHYCEGGKFDEELLAKCKTEIETDHLEIVYPKVPPRTPCSVEEPQSIPETDEVPVTPWVNQNECAQLPEPEAPACFEEGECPEWCEQQ
mmetsp:Transcript_19391/g.46710  ORF Transcript_19391/g.46710 Transcript_19391/m.46710 type:complete len:421 (+) Transcript_19391:59-1321(+)